MDVRPSSPTHPPLRFPAVVATVAMFAAACAHGPRPFCDSEEMGAEARRDCLGSQRAWDDAKAKRAADAKATRDEPDPNRAFREWLRREVLGASSDRVGRLVLYRVSGEGGPEMDAWVAGRRVGRIDSNDFGVAEVLPGVHEVAVSSEEGVLRRSVEVAPGATIIVRVTTEVPNGAGEVSGAASAFMGPALSWLAERKAKADARRARLGQATPVMAVREMGDERMRRRFNLVYARPAPPPPPAPQGAEAGPPRPPVSAPDGGH